MRILKKTTLVAAALVLLLAAPTAADARYRTKVGIGDQSAAMFDSPAFKKLKVKRVRYFVRWDAVRHPAALEAAQAYVRAARRHRVRVLMHISSDDLARKKARLPSLRRYRRDVTKLVRTLRRVGVREWGARNEANHDSQATWKSPRRAAQEFKIVRRACRRCTVVGLDVLDQRGVERYVRRFFRALGSYRRYVRIVGIHNYSDVNRRRNMRGTRSIMRTVRRYNRRARFWLTETGGVVKFGRSFRYSPRRAARRIGYLFTKTRRMHRRIDRVYVYNWTGAPRGARFDAGLTTPSGKPRPGLRMLRRQIRRFSR